MARRPENRPETYGIPVRAFLFTLDQISVMLEVSENTLRTDYVHFDGRSIGRQLPSRLLARNIAEPDKATDWRVAENELIRFMKHRGFKIYDKGWITK